MATSICAECLVNSVYVLESGSIAYCVECSAERAPTTAEALCKAATPGPWIWRHKNGTLYTQHDAPEGYQYGTTVLVPAACEVEATGADLDFIAASRALVPALCAALEEQAARVEALTAERDALAQALRANQIELDEARSFLDAPELHDFSAAVVREAAHQRKRWPSEHDDGKAPADWFWLLGYLSGKALAAHMGDSVDKALHHTISSAAVLANWHAAILGKTNMRPGIEEPKAVTGYAQFGEVEGDPQADEIERSEHQRTVDEAALAAVADGGRSSS